MVEYKGFPSDKGRVSVRAQFVNDWQLLVNLYGDPDGLRYLAEVLTYLADFDQESEGHPPGARAHMELVRDIQLVSDSCELVVWRADASVTGDLPGFMDDEDL